MSKVEYLVRKMTNDNEFRGWYMSCTEVADAVGVSQNTVAEWAAAGAVRVLPDKLKNRLWVSTLDAAKLRAMTPQQSQALGIRRCRDVYVEEHAKHKDASQAETRLSAYNWRERWDNRDLDIVKAMFMRDESVTRIALAVHRTYAAVMTALYKLRGEGELECSPVDDSWKERMTQLLSDQEYKELEVLL
jgi:hypothetical protein